MTQLPILLVGDSVDRPSGLARITRDLAFHLSQEADMRVGTLGFGGHCSRRYPWPQYVMQAGNDGQAGSECIEKVWNDFAKGSEGVVMTIWDASRLLWFSQPRYLQGDDSLQRFLSDPPFQRWGYFPIDSTGPGDKLTAEVKDTLSGYDRVLTITEWAKQIVQRSLGSHRDLDWMPHGLNLDKFQPRSRRDGRARLNRHIREGDVVVGAVGTNQSRKDWGLVFSVVAALREKVKRLWFWCHTDLPIRYWNIPALASDYGLSDILIMSAPMDDTMLSYCYSACDVTLHPGLGEGFGYPIFESLACGVPAIHGMYGGGADVMVQCGLQALLVEPTAFRLDTTYNCVRPVYEPEKWVEKLIGIPRDEPDAFRASVEHLDWRNLWPSAFRRWFREGATRI